MLVVYVGANVSCMAPKTICPVGLAKLAIGLYFGAKTCDFFKLCFLFVQFMFLVTTTVPNKSDSDVILCLQLLSKTLNCTLHMSHSESRDHLCINPILHK